MFLLAGSSLIMEVDMEDYKKILCVIDFSRQSELVVERAVELAGRYGAQLTHSKCHRTFS